MDFEEVLQIIKNIVEDKFGEMIQKKAILPEDRLQEDLGLDSVHLVDLIVALEDKFDIHFDPIDVDLTEVFRTIGSLTNYIMDYLSRTANSDKL